MSSVILMEVLSMNNMTPSSIEDINEDIRGVYGDIPTICNNLNTLISVLNEIPKTDDFVLEMATATKIIHELAGDTPDLSEAMGNDEDIEVLTSVLLKINDTRWKAEENDIRPLAEAIINLKTRLGEFAEDQANVDQLFDRMQEFLKDDMAEYPAPYVVTAVNHNEDETVNLITLSCPAVNVRNIPKENLSETILNSITNLTQQIVFSVKEALDDGAELKDLFANTNDPEITVVYESDQPILTKDDGTKIIEALNYLFGTFITWEQGVNHITCQVDKGIKATISQPAKEYDKYTETFKLLISSINERTDEQIFNNIERDKENLPKPATIPGGEKIE